MPTGAEPFVHVLKNLYVVPTPQGPNGEESKIEDLFGDAIRATVIGGKTFDAGNRMDSDTHYGKKVFAHKVVRPNAESINFDGFRPLLTNLVAAIDKHRGSVAPEAQTP
jgi:RNA-directed DNA polymerase